MQLVHEFLYTIRRSDGVRTVKLQIRQTSNAKALVTICGRSSCCCSSCHRIRKPNPSECALQTVNWAKMTIRPDKCRSFAKKKFKTLVKQCKPKIYVNNKPINAIEERESFQRLARWCSFSMGNSEQKRELQEIFENKLGIIHKLPLHPNNKL